MSKTIDEIEQDVQEWAKPDMDALTLPSPLPVDDAERKNIRLFLQWQVFPLATIALAEHIQAGGDKYCDGVPRWDRSKSPDDFGSALRHAFDIAQGSRDILHYKSLAWRAFALLEKALEKQNKGK